MTLSKNILDHSKSDKAATPAIQRGWAKAAEKLEKQIDDMESCDNYRYTCDIGEVSDGSHTFNELYDHRHALMVALMNSHPDISWRSRLHHDYTKYDGYFIAGMRLPTGDISYHLPNNLWQNLCDITPKYRAPEWDGHTSDDVVKRLMQWELNK